MVRCTVAYLAWQEPMGKVLLRPPTSKLQGRFKARNYAIATTMRDILVILGINFFLNHPLFTIAKSEHPP